jgi:molybdate transport system ATP-binding protein
MEKFASENSNRNHKNIALNLSNSCDKNFILEEIAANIFLQNHIDLSKLRGAFYTAKSIDAFISDELLHDRFIFQTKNNSGLATMSSGERRKRLWQHIVKQNPDYIVLDDVYGTIDKAAQEKIESDLKHLAKTTIIIQLFTRKADLLPFIEAVFIVDEHNTISDKKSQKEFFTFPKNSSLHVSMPKQVSKSPILRKPLVQFNSVHVKYGEREVLKDVDWTIKTGEFWQLTGPNGSGKSSLISFITGDNPRAYGQDISLFGKRKGSGESIWDIKQKIGYFTPTMLQQFTRNDTVENMIISGFMDSVGLYKTPTKTQINTARQWVEILKISDRKTKFKTISPGMQRMVLVARAMVKNPLLLILDEPTIELDEENSVLFIDLINSIQKEKSTAIVYVSHRDEQNLYPEKVFLL